MTEREIKLALGSLLHDVGKVIYRQDGYTGGHSQSGYDFLRDEIGVEDPDLLACVQYHHKRNMPAGEVPDDSLAYIVSFADRAASMAGEGTGSQEDGKFRKSMPLKSIFNHLHGNHEDKCYQPEMLNEAKNINFPIDGIGGGNEDNGIEEISQAFYESVKEALGGCLEKLEITADFVDFLLETLESCLSYVPASMEMETEISLYDHVRLTAAAAGSILRYAQEKGIRNYRKEILEQEEQLCREELFCLYYIDLSGIQGFIYTITSQNALKTLRARSFYLEIMMEHMIDSLLRETGFSRANLIYAGGGRCYLLLPALESVEAAVERYMDNVNQWLLENFDISLYAAWGGVPCSADSLRNVPEGSCGRIFQDMVEQLEKKKNHKYNAAHIRKLNSGRGQDYTRECRACKKISTVDEEGVCPVCRAFAALSGHILHDDLFVVTKEKGEEGLPLPGGFWLAACTEENLRQKRARGEAIVHVYGKNRMMEYGTTKLWAGDYATGRTFEEYAGEAQGIGRIGIIRADVDNLGQAFASGFEGTGKHSGAALLRTAALSRQLSLFFKRYINTLLKDGAFSIDEKAAHPRNAAICYSGGDDLFIVGSWNEIVELALDIREAFGRYTQGRLTFSAGIGVYEAGYPISAIAEEVAGLEEAAKSRPGKNSVSIFPDGKYHEERDDAGNGIMVGDGTYGWEEFRQEVIGEKYRHIYGFFQITEERGKSFLYHLLELIRNGEDKINFARYVYLLSRMEPEDDAGLEQKEAYREFSSKMYQWIKSERDCRQLKTAIQLYAYLRRDKEER